MRYQEAYELIDAGVIAGGIELPVSHNLIEIYFDQAIKEIEKNLGKKADIIYEGMQPGDVEATYANTKKIYIGNFKRHLALNIASMMQGYSDQTYELTKSKYDSKNQVTLIDMEIFSDTGSVVVTWRVKESKDRFYVIDLIVADISLVVTKRSEFNSMLKKVDNDLSKFNEVLFDQNLESYQKITE